MVDCKFVQNATYSYHMIEKHYTFCCLNQGNLNILQCWDFLNSNSISPLWSGIFSFHEGSILIPLFFLSWYLWTIFSIINWFSLATLVIFIVDLRYIFHYNTEMTMCDGYSRWGLHDDLTHILWTQGIPQIFIKGHLHFNQPSGRYGKLYIFPVSLFLVKS